MPNALQGGHVRVVLHLAAAPADPRIGTWSSARAAIVLAPRVTERGESKGNGKGRSSRYNTPYALIRP